MQRATTAGRAAVFRRDATLLSVRALGCAGAGAVAVSAWLIAAFAAAKPTIYVPAGRVAFPAWLSGPLHGLQLGSLTQDRLSVLLLLMTAGYALVLTTRAALPPRALAIAIVAAHVAFLLGPPLLSQDIFGYLSFARLGALHGLDPYTHTALAAPHDALFHYVGWRTVHSPYGPLFTLGTYALAPLGVGGGIWALKIVATAASLGAVALIASAARARGSSPTAAAAIVGLNPVLLVDAVGGGHNDTLLLLAFAAALGLQARGHSRRAAVAVVVAAAIKLSAAVVLPFLIFGTKRPAARWPTLAAAVATGVVVMVAAWAAFGTHALGFLGSIGGEQNMVATHSVVNELARALALPQVHHLPLWWRDLFVGAAAAGAAGALWWTWRGGDWVAGAGWATLALLLGTAWLLPWYAIWALPFAALADDRRLRAAVLAFCAYAVCIRLPLTAGPLGGRRS